MNKSITQEMPNGCGIACFAFVAGISYKETEDFLGEEQAKSNRFILKHFREELDRFGLKYTSKHVRPDQTIDPIEGTIVLLRRSKQFPVGHYLAYHEGKWMDPRINLENDRMFNNPESGFRDVLPGQVMYVLTPIDER
jgi:hypothetical protein